MKKVIAIIICILICLIQNVAAYSHMKTHIDFEDGMIVEEGTHEELMKNTKGLYFNMYNTQAKHYN